MNLFLADLCQLTKPLVAFRATKLEPDSVSRKIRIRHVYCDPVVCDAEQRFVDRFQRQDLLRGEHFCMRPIDQDEPIPLFFIANIGVTLPMPEVSLEV